MTSLASVPVDATPTADERWAAWLARGAEHDRTLNRRVIVISRSDGMVSLKVSLFAARLTGMFLLLRFQRLQIALEPIEAGFPDVAITFGPFGHLLEGAGVDPTRSPLRLAPARNESRTLEHSKVL